jgi:hypothetical protein
LFVHRFDQVAGLELGRLARNCVGLRGSLRRRRDMRAPDSVHGADVQREATRINASQREMRAKDTKAKRCDDGRAARRSLRLPDSMQPIADLQGYRKPRESMMLRPSLRCSPALYFSVDYGRYTSRAQGCATPLVVQPPARCAADFEDDFRDAFEQ